MSDIPSHVELWESGTQECEKLIYHKEKIYSNVPDSCKVIMFRSLAKCTVTKEYILEQASLKRDAHFDDIRKQDKLVPVECVDSLPRQAL